MKAADPSKAADKARRALLTAGEALIGEQGFAKVTPRAIEERAKLGPGAFEEHFATTADLLRALSQAFAEQMITVIEQSTRSGIWKGAPARDVVEVAVRSILDVVLERAGLVRAFLTESTGDASLAADLRRAGTHLSSRLIAVMAECSGAPARPSRAIAFSLLVSAALAHHTILVGDDWSGVAFTKEQLAEETSRLVCAYLGLQPTIAIREDSPDLARTETIAALRTR
jgi:AcrR family transcriptional regulator